MTQFCHHRATIQESWMSLFVERVPLGTKQESNTGTEVVQVGWYQTPWLKLVDAVLEGAIPSTHIFTFCITVTKQGALGCLSEFHLLQIPSL